MGDIIEFVTQPRHQCLFYKVSNNGVFVDIKGSENACIGLSRKPGFPLDFEVLIGINNYCVIRKYSQILTSAPALNILSTQEYRRFWIAWNNSCILMGQDGNSKPIISCFTKIEEILSYVTFCGNGSGDVIYWRFEVPPPYLEKPKLNSIVGGEVEWVAADTQLPDDAVIGGYEQETLYIIRAKYRGSLTPGKFVPSEGVGYISWGGAANECNEFEVLCGYNYKWVETEGNKIPLNAIEGGYSEDYQERLYIGRAFCDGHLIPGKVQASHSKCYVSKGGREVACKHYEIMVFPTAKPKYVNSNFKTPTQTRPTYMDIQRQMYRMAEERDEEGGFQNEWQIDNDSDSDSYNENVNVDLLEID